jgi:hypothetical protein
MQPQVEWTVNMCPLAGYGGFLTSANAANTQQTYSRMATKKSK